MNDKPDMNDLMRQAQEAAERARKYARMGRNEVALASADHFEQGAATAYRNRNLEQLQMNLEAARELERALKAKLGVN
ncbi:phosphotransacetylase [Deinobacterium chartae]|uniref:Phosphotransacetylase n=1 Tax=Deinobacterium chartae TaxID=521158 RepID=A0A841I6U4_9DEIO|nr:response regulator receiver protein [Deinobacterium chartae]MBB6099545.1 phosphotransacetylase [Deinobacterium chartae]